MATTETALIEVQPQGVVATVHDLDDLLPVQASQKAMQRLEAYRHFARQEMKFGEHFDVLPQEQYKCRSKSDTDILKDPNIKKFLNQAGADMWLSAWGLAFQPEIISQSVDYDQPFFDFTIRGWLVHPQTGIRLTSQTASCNSNETKYRWRWVTKEDLDRNPDLKGVNPDTCVTKRFQQSGDWVTKWRVPNPDLADLKNTILQMAEKRAKVKVVRSFFGLSNYFNQPIDEPMAGGEPSSDRDEDREREAGERTTGQRKPPPSSSGTAAKKGSSSLNKAALRLQGDFVAACDGLTEAQQEQVEQYMWEATGVNGWTNVSGPEAGEAIGGYIQNVLPGHVRKVKEDGGSAGGGSQKGMF